MAKSKYDRFPKLTADHKIDTIAFLNGSRSVVDLFCIVTVYDSIIHKSILVSTFSSFGKKQYYSYSNDGIYYT